MGLGRPQVVRIRRELSNIGSMTLIILIDNVSHKIMLATVDQCEASDHHQMLRM